MKCSNCLSNYCNASSGVFYWLAEVIKCAKLALRHTEEEKGRKKKKEEVAGGRGRSGLKVFWTGDKWETSGVKSSPHLGQNKPSPKIHTIRHINQQIGTQIEQLTRRYTCMHLLIKILWHADQSRVTFSVRETSGAVYLNSTLYRGEMFQYIKCRTMI